MPWDCPQGFEQYRDILYLFSEVRGSGKWCQFRCLFPERHRNQDRNWSGLMWVGSRGELVCRCLGCGATWGEFVRETGTTPRDWWPKTELGRSRDRERRTKVTPKLVATYKYFRADGVYLYEKRRFEPGYGGRDKSFEFRRPLPKHLRKPGGIPDGVESWVYGIAADEYGRYAADGYPDFFRLNTTHQIALNIDAAEPVLYRLPELLAARPESPVLVVEGEKDVEILRGLGFVATCGPHGSSTWLPQWSQWLKRRRVVVVPDHNAVGYRHAEGVAGSVMRYGAASVRVVEWGEGPMDPGEGGGIGNWLAKLTSDADQKANVVELCTFVTEYRRAG